jgi:hypothetical protein
LVDQDVFTHLELDSVEELVETGILGCVLYDGFDGDDDIRWYCEKRFQWLAILAVMVEILCRNSTVALVFNLG